METIEFSIVKGLLFDENYARRVNPFLNDSYFDGTIKTIYQTYRALYEKYASIPTVEAMLVTMQSSALDENEFSSCVQLLKSAYTERDSKPDSAWLADETQRYCVDKATYNAIYQAIEILEGRHKTLDKHAIPDVLSEALAINFDETIGSEYFANVESRYAYYTSVESRLPFALNALNILSNGGLPPKTLSAILAGTNVGKSAMMCFLAGEALKAGKDVLYITLEMSEEAIQERVDANLLDMTTDQLKTPELNRELFMSKIAQLKQRTTGRFYCKEYPTSQGHVGHFRHLLRELKLKDKFTPDIVFVDYINICASSRYKHGSGVNSYTMVKAIAEELRGLAVEFGVAIMTATQTNREGNGNNANVDMTSTSESFGLPQTLDFYVALTTNEELSKMGRQLLTLLKTRFGNKAKARPQIVGINWDKMRYYDVQDEVAAVNNAVGGKPDFKPPIGTPVMKPTGIPADIQWS